MLFIHLYPLACFPFLVGFELGWPKIYILTFVHPPFKRVVFNVFVYSTFFSALLARASGSMLSAPRACDVATLTSNLRRMG